MKIIFEGVDGSGKTHVARALEKSCSMRYQHFGPECDDFDYMYEILVNWGGQNQIFDRFHLSAIVYGEVLRNQFRDRLNLPFIEDMLAKEGCLVVLCQPAWDTILLNHDNKEGYSTEQLSNIMHEYNRPKITTLPVIYFDYEQEAYDDLFKRIWDKVIEIKTGITFNEDYPHDG